MAGKFTKIFRDHAPLIEQLFGRIDNVIVKDNYNDVLQEFSKQEEVVNNKARHKDLTDKLLGTKLEDADIFEETSSINYDDPLIKESDAYKRFVEYSKQSKGEGNGTPEVPGITGVEVPEQPVEEMNTDEFQKFIESDPVLKADVEKNYTTKGKKLRDDETLKSSLYTKAGLTDEDVDFYTNYKNPNISEHNRSLSDEYLKYYPHLVSKGTDKDTYAKLLGEKLDGLMLEEDVPQKLTTQFNNGYKFVFDEYGREVSREPIEKQEDAEFDPYGVEKDEQGYFYYENVQDENGEWKPSKLRYLTPQEVIDHEKEQLEASTKGKTGKSGRSRYSGRGGKKDEDKAVISEFDKQNLADLKEFAKLKEESASTGWDEWSKGKEGQKKAERYAELENTLKERFGNTDIHGIANDVYKGKYIPAGKDEMSEIEAVKDLQSVSALNNDLVRFQNDIETNVYSFEDENGVKQPNFNISPADWARELTESGFFENITDAEFEVIASWFQSKTGRSLNDYIK